VGVGGLIPGIANGRLQAVAVRIKTMPIQRIGFLILVLDFLTVKGIPNINLKYNIPGCQFFVNV
jgi:hypothetical protein